MVVYVRACALRSCVHARACACVCGHSKALESVNMVYFNTQLVYVFAQGNDQFNCQSQ